MRRISLIVGAALAMGLVSASEAAYAQVVFLQCGYGSEYLGCGGTSNLPALQVDPIGQAIGEASKLQNLRNQQELAPLERANAELQNQLLQKQLEMQQRLLDAQAPGSNDSSGSDSKCVANYQGTGFRNCY